LSDEGIGYFEILSDKSTSPQDIGQNFFLMPDSLGRPLAEETVKYLRELNSSVVGKATVAVSIASLCSSSLLPFRRIAS
jgi:molybdopterin/thiamine biosynthesis adenylyltransferase